MLDLLSVDYDEPPPYFGKGFYVRPKTQAPIGPNARVETGLTILIDVGGKSSSIWQSFQAEAPLQFPLFRLIDFFDWNLFEFRDFRYFRFLIERWPGQEDKVGREGLIDILSANVFCNALLQLRDRS